MSVFADSPDLRVSGKVGDVEEKKAPAPPAGEEKAATASSTGLGDDAAGANPFDFSAMSGLLNVRHLIIFYPISSSITK